MRPPCSALGKEDEAQHPRFARANLGIDKKLR